MHSKLQPRRPDGPHAGLPGLKLWEQLQAVVDILYQVGQGYPVQHMLDRVAAEHRPGVQSLTYACLRRYRTAQKIQTLLLHKAPPARVQSTLTTALALLLQNPPLYDTHTVVNQSVEMAKRSKGISPFANLINASLRRYLRESATLLSRALQDPSARWNHPEWWISELKNTYPAQWEQQLEKNMQHPAMHIRVAVNHYSPQDYLTLLQEHGIKARQIGATALALSRPCRVSALPGFAQGWVSVQDAAAQLAAPLLGNAILTSAKRKTRPNQNCTPIRILDACAAPGGKTMHLLEWAQAMQQKVEIWALEIDPERVRRIEENLNRGGFAGQVRIAIADATDLSAWWDGQEFEAILLDAPCSASGVVRRHPEIPLLRKPSDLQALQNEQQKILKSLWRVLAPGGQLLYCTCSVFAQEGQTQIDMFVKNNKHLMRRPCVGQLLVQDGDRAWDMQDNEPEEHDGFYYALLEKQAPPS